MSNPTPSARELGSILKVLSHPDRILLIGEIANGKWLSMKELASAVGLSVPRVSQHVSMLRSHRIVIERREGRRKIFQLAAPGILEWMLHGLDLIVIRFGGFDPAVVAEARRLWRVQYDAHNVTLPTS